MDLESAITLVGFAGFAVALFGYLASMKRDLRAEITGSETRTREYVDGKLGAIDSRFDAIDRRFDTVDSRFDALETSTSARFDAVDARFDAFESSTNSRFDALETNTNSRFDALETSTNARFDALDTRVSDLRDDTRAGLTAIGTQLATLEQRTFDLGRRHPGTA